MARVFAVSDDNRPASSISIEDITLEAGGHPSFDGHESVYRISDPDVGLEALVAIHDTALGPAMGGTRIWPYATGDAALADVLRLSRAMTLKAALAGVPTGGGKAVIVADPAVDKTEALLRAYGRAIDRLGGQFVTGEDVGLTVEDADVIASETRHVLGTSGRAGDPAQYTALGVHLGMRAAVRRRIGRESLDGVRVAVQGLGSVGRRLAERLAREGAALTVCDLDPARAAEVADRFGAVAVAPDAIYHADVDVFSPCAMGGVIDDETIHRLRATVVAGSANNQLMAPYHGVALDGRGILYAPDYVINAGGLIALALDLTPEGFSPTAAQARVSRIELTLDEIFGRAVAESQTPERIADRMAYERISAAADRPRAG